MKSYDITVVGGGFSGLMTIANIEKLAKQPQHILWIDPTSCDGRGTAYRTQEPCHLLNVRAARMSAWPDKPEDFLQWLHKNHPGKYTADDFVPRMVYGSYLESIKNNIKLPIQTRIDQVTAIERHEAGFALSFHNTPTCQTKAVVLACGNPPCADLRWPQTAPYIHDFWRWRFAKRRITTPRTVLIVGSGLTAIDAALSLQRGGFNGKMTLLSTHGWLPMVHAPDNHFPQSEDLIAAIQQKPTALHYLKTLRAYSQSNWRGAIDALRPHTVSLWQKLPEAEKSRFLRHLSTLWNIHRHRMAPMIAQQLEKIPDLEICAGRLVQTQEDGTVILRHRGKKQTQTLKADLILNCTGPDFRSMTNQPLFRSLLEQNLIRKGPLGLGITELNCLDLYTLGPPLVGELWETTAVPDLRQQAAALAARICKNLYC